MHQIASMIGHLNSVKPGGISRFAEALTQYKHYIHTKSFIVIISDFLLDLKEVEKSFVHLGDHDVVVIQVLDRKEIDLAIEGDLRLHDAETSGVLRTFITPRLRSSYKEKMHQHVLAVEKECNDLGYKYFLVPTDKPIFDAFWEMLR